MCTRNNIRIQRFLEKIQRHPEARVPKVSLKQHIVEFEVFEKIYHPNYREGATKDVLV